MRVVTLKEGVLRKGLALGPASRLGMRAWMQCVRMDGSAVVAPRQNLHGAGEAVL